MAEWRFFFYSSPGPVVVDVQSRTTPRKKTFTITRTAELNYNSELPTHLKFTHGTGSQSGCPANQHVRAHACMHYTEPWGARIVQWCAKRASRFITSVSGTVISLVRLFGMVASMALLPITTPRGISACIGRRKKVHPSHRVS